MSQIELPFPGSWPMNVKFAVRTIKLRFWAQTLQEILRPKDGLQDDSSWIA